ncbi:MAG: hypothetical protein SGBAC_008779 [Bacillariaceae sp.]
MTAFRIGSVKQQKVSENRVRHHLRSVREKDSITELFFFHIEFTDRILDDCRKLFVRDGRKFTVVKLLSCTGKTGEIVTLMMDYSSTGSLTVSNCEATTLSAINESLRTNQSLRRLRISASIMAAQGLDGLVVNNTLEELDLSGTHLSQCAVECLSETLGQNSGLRTLKLDDCDLDDQAMATILKSLLNHERLNTLDLSNNAASSQAMLSVALLMAQHQQLLHLSINCLRFSDDFEPSCMFQAISALQSNTTLEALDISGNHLTNEAVLGLCECLSNNETLRCLDISDAGVDEKGLSIVAQHLGEFQGLRDLNLSENDLTEDGAESLLAGLQSNRLLQSLGPIGQDFKCSCYIEHYLDLNLAGRRAFQNDIALAVWPHLLARTATADLSCGRNENALFSLLRGPALFER